MTYFEDEASQQSRSPVELYAFFGPGVEYRYTTAKNQQVSYGETYDPIPGLRSDDQSVSDGSADSMSITIPITTQVVQDYALSIPPDGLYVYVYRWHPDTNSRAILWKGNVTNFALQQEVAVLRVPLPLPERMDSKLPKHRQQALCNNTLYDQLCKVPSILHKEDTTIATFVNLGETLMTVTSMGGRPQGWATGGYILHVPTGQTRMLVSNVTEAIGLVWPFSGAQIGDAVTVYAGCDHSLQTCRAKFDNKDNFFGMKYLTQTENLGDRN